MAGGARGEGEGEGEGRGGEGGEGVEVGGGRRGEGCERGRGRGGRGEGEQGGGGDGREGVGRALGLRSAMSQRLRVDWGMRRDAAGAVARSEWNGEHTVSRPTETVPTNLRAETFVDAMGISMCRVSE